MSGTLFPMMFLIGYFASILLAFILLIFERSLKKREIKWFGDTSYSLLTLLLIEVILLSGISLTMALATHDDPLTDQALQYAVNSGPYGFALIVGGALYKFIRTLEGDAREIKTKVGDIHSDVETIKKALIERGLKLK